MNILKILTTIFISLLFQNSFGQDSEIKIFGKVKDIKDSSLLEDVYVSIRVNDSITFGTKTNKDGGFVLLVARKALSKSNRLFFNHDMREYKRKHPPDTTCGYMNWFWGYLSNYRDIYSDSLINQNSKEINIVLGRVEAEIRLPAIVFDKNCSVPTLNITEDSTYQNPKNVIRNIHCIMRDNPKIIIKISGYCNYDENNKQKLSEERARYAERKLIELGINPKRIKTIGYGGKGFLYTKNNIQNTKTPNEKGKMELRNRSACFSIISWDFEE